MNKLVSLLAVVPALAVMPVRAQDSENFADSPMAFADAAEPVAPAGKVAATTAPEKARTAAAKTVAADASAAGVAAGQAAAAAGMAAPRETFGKWRIAVGAAFNGRVRARLGSRNLPIPEGYDVPASSSKAAAWKRANAHQYDGNGHIDPDDLDNGFDTENWGFPVSDYQGGGRFLLHNAYQEVVQSATSVDHRDSSRDEQQFGVALEASRELYIHDEEAEHRWGVDLVAAASYYFQRDVYCANGTVHRTDTVRDGDIQTEVVDADAMYDYDNGWGSPSGGMYGDSNYNRTFFSPAFGWAGVGSPYDAGGPTRGVASSTGYHASGDYQELEMLLMLRPWYEITDWWRVFVEAGVGVSWGRFDSSFASMSGCLDESFDQWDCYGVAGFGTAVRWSRFDIALDGLGRFLRDDMDVNGRHVNGSVERSDWGLRMMLGYSF